MRTSTVFGQTTDRNDNNFRPSGRVFEINTLPVDLHRVFKQLDKKFGEEYALTAVFLIRTAIELHRAWHMTLLTSSLLQQMKEKFKLRMTWNLGVIDLIFRLEDGNWELHRRVPYDYDSEFQDMYEKIAVALIEGQIGIHDALIFQSETKKGLHTSRSGLFLRANPGRLLLYPFQAATCSVIFFGGDWTDCWVAAICGITAGLIEWALSSERLFANVKESKLLSDSFVGFSTGIIGGLFYKHYHNEICLSAVFLGTLYWFFYGTAFVIGFLEIIAGELETGVIRFLAVSVKTFVLSVMSAAGLTFVLREKVYDDWLLSSGENSDNCFNTDLGDQWWRIPFYILCSVAVLGQYRFVVTKYWLGLIVMVVGYEAQYSVDHYLNDVHSNDGMNTVFSNVIGAAAAVFSASFLCLLFDYVRKSATIANLQNNGEKMSLFGKFIKSFYDCLFHFGTRLGIHRGLSRKLARVREKQEKLTDTQVLSDGEEAILIAGIVESQEFNVWSFLMPAVYQLVPGSKIAMFWYNAIFPPDNADISAEYGLWIVSVSLALGLILGLALVRVVGFAFFKITSLCLRKEKPNDEIDEIISKNKRGYMRKGVSRASVDDDPSDIEWETEFNTLWENKESKPQNHEDGSDPTGIDDLSKIKY
eukprot:CAMPEP_0170918682 /NCGR_PEP_ID=MMETSP0735-20130129/8134_1 /TAXON_ID=186038 /ORGANISM="Fragilariopsis kerguelensis, Strain L26-C5" /LENGTH=644 /DNA_ID=CAMNT_0011317219 /DNA_START=45 /DNA_END=1979 /DNA_ORIENTATION=+